LSGIVGIRVIKGNGKVVHVLNKGSSHEDLWEGGGASIVPQFFTAGIDGGEWSALGFRPFTASESVLIHIG
jgi:hypothetical protein